jgi:hypothetical protein
MAHIFNRLKGTDSLGGLFQGLRAERQLSGPRARLSRIGLTPGIKHLEVTIRRGETEKATEKLIDF